MKTIFSEEHKLPGNPRRIFEVINDEGQALTFEGVKKAVILSGEEINSVRRLAWIDDEAEYLELYLPEDETVTFRNDKVELFPGCGIEME